MAIINLHSISIVRSMLACWLEHSAHRSLTELQAWLQTLYVWDTHDIEGATKNHSNRSKEKIQVPGSNFLSPGSVCISDKSSPQELGHNVEQRPTQGHVKWTLWTSFSGQFVKSKATKEAEVQSARFMVKEIVHILHSYISVCKIGH